MSTRASIFLVLALSLPLACQSTEGDRSGSLPVSLAATGARLAADVAWLADDEREGRRAGTRGADISADWLAAQLAALGLEPAGDDGFFQAFEVPLPARDGGESWVAGPVVDGKPLRFSSSFEVRPLTPSSRGGVRAPLEFRGFGIQDEGVWNDYGRGDVTGDVVLIVRGAPAAPRPVVVEAGAESQNVERAEGWGSHAKLFHKIMTAKRLGAQAVIVAQHPRDEGAELPAFESGRELFANIPALIVSASVAGELVPDYAALVAAADAEPFSALNEETPTVELFADVFRERGTTRNVLARCPGGEGPTVVVGAHFDHLGHGGTGSLAPGESDIHNGADDNASGTAVVLELARRFVEGPAAEGDVVLALWSGEELGLLGSEHWAKNPTVPLDEVAANLNLDMVGRAGDGKLQVLGAGTSPGFAGLLAEAGPEAGLELEVSLSGTGLGGSDHQVFLKNGIPALHLFSGIHDDYHRPTDDTERFESEGAARVADLAFDLVRRMQAEGDLAFVEVREPKREGGRPRVSVRFGSRPEYGAEVEGLLLAGTSPNSPAERAGLLKGDVIQQVGDVEVTNIYDFMYALEIYKAGDVVLTRFLRDGETQSVRVTLESLGQE